MLIIFAQVFILFFFAAVGYILCKCNIVNSNHSQLLSKLLVYVFLPCNIFKTFAANFTRGYFQENYEIIISSLVIISVLAVLMHFVAKAFSQNKYERSLYEYSLIVPNYGYMGYALAEGLLGEAALMNLMMFALPVSCYIYTIGFSMLTKRPLSIKKLLNPVILAMSAGMLAGLFALTLPEAVYSILNKSSACMAPVSMLLAGIVISDFELRKLLCNKVTYIVVALRLVVIPTVLGIILNFICTPATVQAALLLYAMPCGLNTIVFSKMIEENCEIGAGLAFVSNVLACMTIPLIFELFKIGV